MMTENMCISSFVGVVEFGAVSLMHHRPKHLFVFRLQLEAAEGVCGNVHSRAEEGDEEGNRRVRPRLELENYESQASTVQTQLSPVGSTNLEISLSPASPIHKSKAEELEVRKLGIMERQLDLQIMTQSEAGLPTDAVRYIRWQRHLVMEKMRQDRNSNNHM
ncbi:hypothetical protein V7S43_002251 [Phytophthora oleae]|uniref:Uncharacterized protein n=1 Tax=Phytophthora oleae TaxID=2107226 RepID=A0ABD3G730_9STRA